MKNTMIGALAGCVATAPMTLVMETLFRQLPTQERYPLPPRQITMQLAEAADVKDELTEAQRLWLTLGCHFGMGTFAGALYGALASDHPLPAPLKGAMFGLGVWAGNYLGLLPALGILNPATEHPVRRTALMITAHVVWGCVTAALLSALINGSEARAFSSDNSADKN